MSSIPPPVPPTYPHAHPPQYPPPYPPAYPPQPLNYAAPPSGLDLRTIALRQKGIIYCILGYLLCVVLQFVVPMPVTLLLGLACLGAAVTGAVFVFMLSLSIYSTGVGILLGILTLIPLLGLIVLLVINAKATSILRAHRIHVGLLGASLSQLPPPGQAMY